jgi:hypothetical protein
LAFVIAVGQHVFVNSIASPSRPVALGNESGTVLSGVYLVDGLEVEVLAWRPRGASDTRYRVRAPDGEDGWLPAVNLRKSLVAPPPPATPTPAQAMVPTESDGRPFGQRAHVARGSVPGPVSPATARPAAGGGRRFGQHF